MQWEDDRGPDVSIGQVKIRFFERVPKKLRMPHLKAEKDEWDDADLLLPSLGHMLVRFEERANVYSLTAPEIAMDGPIKRELQTTSVQRPVEEVNSELSHVK